MTWISCRPRPTTEMYERLIQIEFNHCDPAGIVFYPRYFEMVNSVCENFFREVAGLSYAMRRLFG